MQSRPDHSGTPVTGRKNFYFILITLKLFNRFCKWHDDQVVEIQFFLFRISSHPDPDMILVCLDQKGSQYTIPERKENPVVGIPLFYFYRVVNPVHGWRDKQNPQKGFKPPGEFQAAVMELCCSHHSDFKYQYPRKIGSDKKNERYPDDRRENKLASVETGRGGHIHVQITVMNPVEPPEKRHFMVEQMPDIQHEIHKYHGGQNFQAVWDVKEIQNAHPIFCNIIKSFSNQSGKDEANDNIVEPGD